MPIDDNEKLRAAVRDLHTERDAALLALERMETEADDRNRLLVEEQDRFVSRLLETHDREIGKLRLDAEEAQTVAELMGSKLERDRASLNRLEEDLATARVEIERLRQQRDLARAEARRAPPASGAQATIDELRRELSLARAMLGDAMQGGPTFRSVEPQHGVHEPSLPPRESGIVRQRGARRASTPPGVARQREPRTRSEAPRAATGGGGANRDGPPSSR